MVFLSRLAAGLIALACVSTAAQAAVNKVVHRTGACVKDADNWCTGKSTEGGFTVTLPMAFNDYTITEDNGDFMRGDAIGGGSTDGIRFLVTRAVYKGGAAASRKIFDKTASGGGDDLGTVVSRRRGKVAGHDAVEVVVDTREGRMHMRSVLLDKDLIVMIGVMTVAQDAEHPGAMDQFLNSLVVTRP